MNRGKKTRILHDLHRLEHYGVDIPAFDSNMPIEELKYIHHVSEWRFNRLNGSRLMGQYVQAFTTGIIMLGSQWTDTENKRNVEEYQGLEYHPNLIDNFCLNIRSIGQQGNDR